LEPDVPSPLALHNSRGSEQLGATGWKVWIAELALAMEGWVVAFEYQVELELVLQEGLQAAESDQQLVVFVSIVAACRLQVAAGVTQTACTFLDEACILQDAEHIAQPAASEVLDELYSLLHAVQHFAQVEHIVSTAVAGLVFLLAASVQQKPPVGSDC
jgi:hypothetical protein